MVRTNSQVEAHLSRKNGGAILKNSPKIHVLTTISVVKEKRVRKRPGHWDEEHGYIEQKKETSKNKPVKKKLSSGKHVFVREITKEAVVNQPPIEVPIVTTSIISEENQFSDESSTDSDSETKWISSKRIPERNPIIVETKRASRPSAKLRDNDFSHSTQNLRDPVAGPSRLAPVQYRATSKKAIPSDGISYVRDAQHIKDGVWPIIAILDESIDYWLVVYDHWPRIETLAELRSSQERHGGVLIDTVLKSTANLEMLECEYTPLKDRWRDKNLEERRSEATMEELYKNCYTRYDKEVGTGAVVCSGGAPFSQDITLELLVKYPQINRTHFDVLEALFQKMMDEGRISRAFDFIDASYELVFLALIFDAWKELPSIEAVFVPNWMGKASVKQYLVDEQESGAIEINPDVAECKPLTAFRLKDLVNKLRRGENGIKRDVLFVYFNTPEMNNRSGVIAHTFICIVSNSSNTGKRTIHVWDPAVDGNRSIPKPIRNLNGIINKVERPADRPVEYANGNQGTYDYGCLMRSLRLMSLILGGLPWKKAFDFKPHQKYA